MKITRTTQVTLVDKWSNRVTYDGKVWTGDPMLVQILESYTPDQVQGYQYDPIMNYAEYICSQWTLLKVDSYLSEQQEYPDGTIF